ncbi:MAG: acyltransferase [Bacteroidales bacterium]|nr:acyltransferase [Bacteroidales bacterium]
MTVQGDKRINWLLILQGWAMLWVVIGHSPLGEPCTGPLWETVLYRFAYSFHMPLFMLVSGWLFYRTRLAVSRWSYGAVLRDKALRILLPGLVFSLVAYALKIAFPGEMSRQVSLTAADVLHSYLFPYDNPLRELWFLVTLFWMFALLPLWRVTLRCKWGMWLSVALLVALWFFPLRTGLLCLDRVCTHAIWFYLGMVISREEYVERAFSVRPWLTVLIGVAIYAIGIYTLPIVTTAGGILLSFGLALLADRFLPRLFFSFRDYTYQIFLMGIFAQMLVKILYRHALGSWPYLIVWLLCVAVGLYIPVLIARLVERIPFRPLALCLGLRAPKKTK